MKHFDWDDAKNAKLRAERGIGFEDIVFHIERGDLLNLWGDSAKGPFAYFNRG